MATSSTEHDQRGRHTTVATQLLPLADGGWLIDTPGFRAVSLWLSGRGIERAHLSTCSTLWMIAGSGIASTIRSPVVQCKQQLVPVNSTHCGLQASAVSLLKKLLSRRNRRVGSELLTGEKVVRSHSTTTPMGSNWRNAITVGYMTALPSTPDMYDLRMSEAARPLYEKVKAFIAEEIEPKTAEFFRLERDVKTIGAMAKASSSFSTQLRQRQKR